MSYYNESSEAYFESARRHIREYLLSGCPCCHGLIEKAKEFLGGAFGPDESEIGRDY